MRASQSLLALNRCWKIKIAGKENCMIFLTAFSSRQAIFLPIISVLNDVAQRLVDSIYAVIDATEKFRKKFNLLLKKHSFCGKIRKKQPLVDKMKSKVGGVEIAVACIIEPQG